MQKPLGVDVIHIGSSDAMQVDLFLPADTWRCVMAAAAGLQLPWSKFFTLAIQPNESRVIT
jgi:hypothetical protein